MNKLTLSETVTLALTNHLPLELVPGKTDHGHYRFHCLVNHQDFLELKLVFGDDSRGHLFDSAWIRTNNGQRVRISEADVRQFLQTPAPTEKWTRDIPAAPAPKLLNALVLNPDLGQVRMFGEVRGLVTEDEVTGYEVWDHEVKEFFYIYPADADLELNIGGMYYFAGTYRLDNSLHDAVEIA